MASVTTTMDTSATPERVWAVLSDPGLFPSWVSDHEGFVGQAPAGFAVGDSFGQRIRVMGMPAEISWRVDRVEVPSLVALSGSGPMGIGVATRYQLQPVDTGSSLSWTMEFSGGLVVAVGAQIEREVGTQQRVSLDRLKALLES